MAWKLTMEEISEYKEAFSIRDEDHDGKITTADMEILMRSLGQNFSNAELKEIISNVGKGKNEENATKVEFHEFLDLMARYRKDEESPEKLIKAFKYFDRTNIGTIDYSELKHVLATIAETLSEKEMDELDEIVMKKECIDQGGRLLYIDLVKTMISKD